MSRITRQEALTRLARGAADDVKAYSGLLDLLEQQFDAALHHRSAQLSELADAVSTTVEPIEQRRRQRVNLVQALLGPDGKMPQIFDLLQGETRHTLERNWAALQDMVPECKRRNLRNSALLSEQYSIMQRVLHGEEQIYAPG